MIMHHLGREIKKARADKGWKQKDLQASTGLTQKYLSEIEQGKVDPRWGIVLRIATALGISLDQLAREDLPSPTPEALASGLA
jgi:transcriptional regulator with XRE-family HTH domain